MSSICKSYILMNKNHNKRTYITYQMYLYKTENHTDPATQETTQPTAYT